MAECAGAGGKAETEIPVVLLTKGVVIIQEISYFFTSSTFIFNPKYTFFVHSCVINEVVEHLVETENFWILGLWRLEKSNLAWNQHCGGA